MLTVSEANEDISRALNGGARGYVLKGVGFKTLAEILRTVASGENYHVAAPVGPPALHLDVADTRRRQDLFRRSRDANTKSWSAWPPD